MRVIAVFLCAILVAYTQTDGTVHPLRGFPQDEWKKQWTLEEKARAIPDPARLRRYMERMAQEPHHAGSPASKVVAEYGAGLLKEWGYDVRIEEFEALLPYPTKRSLEMTAPVKFKAKLQEPIVGEDKDSGDKNQLPTYNAYSATGDVTAALVYVNYGIPEDYEQLKKLGVDVKGKIVIARYGKSWRGTKPKVAAENGAVGCIIYSDPRDDGYFQGDVYPKGALRPPAGVQRGSVMDMPLYVGDPLSPGWASEKGSKRLRLEESTTLMKIPVLPISYEDAQPLLENLGGPVAPEPWRGALPITYHVGGGPATVHLKLDFDWTTKPLYNVIATMKGAVYPDEWIIYGNHHDAWVNGAHDPLSGAGPLLESARALAELKKQGWMPKRTIMFALWDGEEFGLVGSTEWAEKHAEDLKSKAVVYINSDTNGKGTLGAGGSAVLETFMADVLRDIQEPVTRESLLSKSGPRRRPGDPEPAGGKDPRFRLGPLGAGSDYVVFLHNLGVASLNLGFGGPDQGGVYHSIYDSSHWYTKYSDGSFVYGKALAQVMTTAIMRLADARLLPFEFNDLINTVSGYVTEIKGDKRASSVDLASVISQLEKLKSTVDAYNQQVKAGKWSSARDNDLARVNSILYRSERALLDDGGLPKRPWYKYQISAPGLYTGYGAKTLPGIREAVEADRAAEANQQAKAVIAALARWESRIREATDALAALNR